MGADTASLAEARKELLARDPAPRGPGLRRALSDVADGFLTDLLGAEPGVALVGVGGYGRAELSPGSDLDILLLHDGKRKAAEIAALADRIWYPIWDSGMKLDHSVRTPKEARKVALGDLPVALGLLYARHVAGDPSLTSDLRETAFADWRAHAVKRLPELREACVERAERNGDLAFRLEGDLKECRGGLRDAHALHAISASWLADIPHGEPDYARETLLDVRDALHRVTGRATDRLALQEQDAVAADLGLLDADALMYRVSSAARVVAYASETAWRRVGQALASRSGRFRQAQTARRPLADGVVEQDGEAVLARAAAPARDPALVLRAAAAAADAGLPLAPHALRRLAAESAPMPVPWPKQARDAFVALLGAGAGTVDVWESLDRTGVISRLIPDWERVRCRVQRNALHVFTVDRHLVEAAVQAAALKRRVSRPDLLLVAAFLHDIGKGWPGDHSAAGATIAADLAVRLGFEEADTEVLVKLVRHHLLLADLATHRDLDDPATVTALVEAVGDVSTLNLLHALTEADGRATGPTAWNPWRANLISDLAGRAEAVFAGEEPPAVPVLTDEQAAFVEQCRAKSVFPGIAFEHFPDSMRVTVVAPDRSGLLALVAGVLSLHRAAIASAQATGVDGLAVQVWTVTSEYGRLPEPDRLRGDIHRALDGDLDVAARLAAREESARQRKTYPIAPPKASVLRGASADATVVEVRAHDSAGLLHRVAALLAAAPVDIRQARVATLGAEAVDVFYVVDPSGEPLEGDVAKALADHLTTVLRTR